MRTVGLATLEDEAPDLIRLVESGEEVAIEVDGRVRARLVPLDQRQWRTWEEISDIFVSSEAASADETSWQLERFDDEPTDPFLRSQLR